MYARPRRRQVSCAGGADPTSIRRGHRPGQVPARAERVAARRGRPFDRNESCCRPGRPPALPSSEVYSTGAIVLPLVVDHDVVGRSERVVVAGREGVVVGLDEPFVRPDLVHRFADRVPVGAAGLVDRPGHEVHGVIGVGGADRREDVLRPLDLRELLHERGQHPLAGGALPAEEAVGLDEVRLARRRSGELGETSARDAPVRDHRCRPAHALAGLHHLRPRRRVHHQDDGVRPGVLQARELRHHVDVVVLELLDTGDLDGVVPGVRRHEALLVRLAHGLLISMRPAFFAPNARLA